MKTDRLLIFSMLVLLFVLGVTGLGMCGTCYNRVPVTEETPCRTHRGVRRGTPYRMALKTTT